MPTDGELHRKHWILRMVWVDRWMRIIVPGVARRVMMGKAPQPGWLSGRWLTVVSADVDPGAGIGAVWMVWRPRSARSVTHTALMEFCGGQWRYTGGGSTSGGDLPAARRAVGQPGQPGVIELSDSAGSLSYAYRREHPRSAATAIPWHGTSRLRVAAEADHLLLGTRRVEVPGHGALIAAWTSRSTGSGGIRPLIVAVGRNGSELSRIGPNDSMDSYTWATLSSELE